MKETIKNVILMGLGAVSLTGEKAQELKKDLLDKGEKLYNQGAIKNEELKRDIKEKIQEKAHIEYKSVTKDDVVDFINCMSDEEKAEMKELLNKKSSECGCSSEEKFECSEEKECECKEEKCECTEEKDCGCSEEKK